MDLSGDAGLESHLHCRQNGPLVMLQDKGQDLDHLPVTSGLPEQMLLQPFECFGQFGEGRAVAQGSRLALDDRQIMPPIVEGLAKTVVRPLDDAAVLADELPSAATTIRSG